MVDSPKTQLDLISQLSFTYCSIYPLVCVLLHSENTTGPGIVYLYFTNSHLTSFTATISFKKTVRPKIIHRSFVYFYFSSACSLLLLRSLPITLEDLKSSIFVLLTFTLSLSVPIYSSNPTRQKTTHISLTSAIVFSLLLQSILKTQTT